MTPSENADTRDQRTVDESLYRCSFVAGDPAGKPQTSEPANSPRPVKIGRLPVSCKLNWNTNRRREVCKPCRNVRALRYDTLRKRNGKSVATVAGAVASQRMDVGIGPYHLDGNAVNND